MSLKQQSLHHESLIKQETSSVQMHANHAEARFTESRVKSGPEASTKGRLAHETDPMRWSMQRRHNKGLRNLT